MCVCACMHACVRVYVWLLNQFSIVKVSPLYISYNYICYTEMLCILNIEPGDVTITDVRCDAVNLINQCDVEWNVSVIVICAIGVIIHT